MSKETAGADGSPNEKQNSSLGSVSKTIRTLQAFTVSRPEWTLTQLSKELDISKGTVTNILKTLQFFGYISNRPIAAIGSASICWS